MFTTLRGSQFSINDLVAIYKAGILHDGSSSEAGEDSVVLPVDCLSQFLKLVSGKEHTGAPICGFILQNRNRGALL